MAGLEVVPFPMAQRGNLGYGRIGPDHWLASQLEAHFVGGLETQRFV
jgi:hypothetical protein